MTKVVTCNENNYFTWGDKCKGWHLTDNSQLSVIKEIMPPKTKESKHYHLKSHQVFYILEGEAEFTIDEESFIVNSNQAISIVQGQQHRITNNSDRNLIFLVISSPSTTHDRVEVLS